MNRGIATSLVRPFLGGEKENVSTAEVFVSIAKSFPEGSLVYKGLKELYMYGTEEQHDAVERIAMVQMSDKCSDILKEAMSDLERVEAVASVLVTKKELAKKIRKFGKLNEFERAKVMSSIFTRSAIEDEYFGKKISNLTMALSKAILYTVWGESEMPGMLVQILGYRCIENLS